MIRQTVLPFKLEITRDTITSLTGLALLGEFCVGLVLLAEIERGLYTRKARELDGGRLEKVRQIFRQVSKEITEDRPDYEITEADLW